MEIIKPTKQIKLGLIMSHIGRQRSNPRPRGMCPEQTNPNKTVYVFPSRIITRIWTHVNPCNYNTTYVARLFKGSNKLASHNEQH